MHSHDSIFWILKLSDATPEQKGMNSSLLLAIKGLKQQCPDKTTVLKSL